MMHVIYSLLASNVIQEKMILLEPVHFIKVHTKYLFYTHQKVHPVL